MSAAAPLVLIVEDEPAQREILAYNLRAEGFRVTLAHDGEEALAQAQDEVPDLVVLDWMMPRLSGLEVCRQLKAQHATRGIPVIMLSARSEEGDRVRGLDIGADDYVTKPYAVGELIARVRANLRRSRPALSGETLNFQDITLNSETHRVSRSGQDLKLGPTEFRLLATLMERPGRVWSREQLLDRVWGRDIYVETRTVDVHVGRLRKALCQNGGEDPLRTVRGAGYALG
jgi:two-component system phosphate regulon response regulator PhoB